MFSFDLGLDLGVDLGPGVVDCSRVLLIVSWALLLFLSCGDGDDDVDDAGDEEDWARR